MAAGNSAMTKHLHATPLAALLFATVLTACATRPNETNGLPATPAAFRESDPVARQAAAADMPANGEWWLVFADPLLDGLVQRANRNNLTIRLTAARLAEARAIQKTIGAAQWPTLALSVNATREEGPLTNAASSNGNLFVAGANLSYEADLFGRLARESKAASLDTAEREDLLRSAKLLVQAEIARAYFTLRAVDAERALVRGTAASRQRTAQLTEGLFHSGLAPELAFMRLRAEAEAVASDALTLDQHRAELEHELAVLVGETASSFQIAPSDRSASLPNIPPNIPGAVLVRRPDVGAARQAMIAAQMRTGVARDSWLPTLSLTAFGGLASPALGSLVAASAVGSGLGALLALPIFDGGRYRATVARADANLDAAAAIYGQQILVAIKEVEDQLSALRLLAKQEAVLKSAVDAAARTEALVASNHKMGLASQLEVLDAERNALRDRRQALLVNAARFQATVGLVKALGGGWDVSAPSVRDAR
jgi:multidrug efflux system outer membrane protein